MFEGLQIDQLLKKQNIREGSIRDKNGPRDLIYTSLGFTLILSAYNKLNRGLSLCLIHFSKNIISDKIPT